MIPHIDNKGGCYTAIRLTVSNHAATDDDQKTLKRDDLIQYLIPQIENIGWFARCVKLHLHHTQQNVGGKEGF